MKYKSVFIIYLLILALVITISAKPNTVVLIQGKVKNQSDGKGIGTRLVFVSDKGKKTICKSNSTDGSYQQSLTSGSIYSVYIKDHVPVNGEFEINIPEVAKYKEIDQDIVVTGFKPGVEIIKEKVFEPNDSMVSNELFIEKIKNFLDINPSAKIKIVVSSYDSWLKGIRKKVEKVNSRGKKYYKRVWFSTKTQLDDLLDSRINMLDKAFRDNQIFVKKDIFEKDLRVVSERKKRKRRKVEGKRKKYEYYMPDYPNVTVKIEK